MVEDVDVEVVLFGVVDGVLIVFFDLIFIVVFAVDEDFVAEVVVVVVGIQSTRKSCGKEFQ